MESESSITTFEREVDAFLMAIYNEVYDRNVEAIKSLYENDFNAITEKYYANTRWPSVEAVTKFYEKSNRLHSLIMTLYTELYYRHVYSRCIHTLTWDDRTTSWSNYRLLLNYFVDDECGREPGSNKGLWLPSQWLWDMLDEFTYQFQDTARYRAKLGKFINDPKTTNEIKEDIGVIVSGGGEVWKCGTVFEYLHQLVDKSDIVNYIKTHKVDFSRGTTQDIELQHQLGYFAIICLLRMHVMLGNSCLGVYSLGDLELSSRAFYWRLPACHITLFYYLGFAYMMMRRYTDATKHLSAILIFLIKQRSYISSSSYQQGAMTKLMEKMYLLVMICNRLAGSKLDENILATIKDKYSYKYYKIEEDDEDVYKDLFGLAAPKFINPYIPPIDSIQDLQTLYDTIQEPHERQMHLFIKEVRYQKKVSNIRSFAKLYNNIQLQKLAQLMEVRDPDPEEYVQGELLCFKNKSRQIVWVGGPLVSGETVSSHSALDVDICVDTLHVKNSKPQAVYTDYFLRQTDRCQDLLQTITKGTQLPPEGETKNRYETKQA